MLMRKLRAALPNECKEIELFFSKFRLETSADFYYPFGEPEDAEEFSLPSPYKEYKVEYIREHICRVLMEYGFSNPKALCDKYFFDAGLGYEISHTSLVGIESPLKILDLAKHIKYFPTSWHRRFKATIMAILYNEGHFHFNDCATIIDRKKSIKFFERFTTIFTTNYDLVIDDLVADKVKHLHGGFGFQTPFKRNDNRTSSSGYYIVLGADGEDKSRSLFGYKPIDKPSLLKGYFASLATEDFDELHIFGYSGENDNHINNAILNNDRIKKIIYYCSPNKINSKDYRFHCASKFVAEPRASYSKLLLASWDCLWTKIT